MIHERPSPPIKYILKYLLGKPCNEFLIKWQNVVVQWFAEIDLIGRRICFYFRRIVTVPALNSIKYLIVPEAKYLWVS